MHMNGQKSKYKLGHGLTNLSGFPSHAYDELVNICMYMLIVIGDNWKMSILQIHVTTQISRCHSNMIMCVTTEVTYVTVTKPQMKCMKKLIASCVYMVFLKWYYCDSGNKLYTLPESVWVDNIASKWHCRYISSL